MPKISCHSRKEKKCKLAPKTCNWDDQAQKCSKIIKAGQDVVKKINVPKKSSGLLTFQH